MTSTLPVVMYDLTMTKTLSYMTSWPQSSMFTKLYVIPEVSCTEYEDGKSARTRVQYILVMYVALTREISMDMELEFSIF